MIVLMLEHVTPSLRGELTRWLLEPRPGVFVGKLSALVRDKLWAYVQEKAPKGAGMLVHNAQNEQGFVIRTFGQTKREVVDFEGLTLIRQPGEHKRVKAGKRVN
jgi:CRISPR-associated protein Cas2